MHIDDSVVGSWWHFHWSACRNDYYWGEYRCHKNPVIFQSIAVSVFVVPIAAVAVFERNRDIIPLLLTRIGNGDDINPTIVCDFNVRT